MNVHISAPYSICECWCGSNPISETVTYYPSRPNNCLFRYPILDYWTPLPEEKTLALKIFWLYPKFSFLHWKIKVQRSLMSSKTWSGVVEDSEGSSLGFWFLKRWAGVNNDPNNLCSEIQHSTLKKKDAKNPHVLEVQDWGFGGLWRFLTGVLVPDHDGEGSTMSQMTYVPKFSFLHCI